MRLTVEIIADLDTLAATLAALSKEGFTVSTIRMMEADFSYPVGHWSVLAIPPKA